MSDWTTYEVVRPFAPIVCVLREMASLYVKCVDGIMGRINLGYCILFFMELAFAMCMYEILFVGWAVERHCTVEGDTVSIEISSSNNNIGQERFHVLMNATFRVDSTVFVWKDHPITLSRVRDLFVGHDNDTEQVRPTSINITWDIAEGVSKDHVFHATMEGSAYQLCYEQGTGISAHMFLPGSQYDDDIAYSFNPPRNPDGSILSLAILIGFINVLVLVLWCANRRSR